MSHTTESSTVALLRRRAHDLGCEARRIASVDIESARQCEAMRDALNRAYHKSLNRRFVDDAPISAFSGFAA